MRVSSVFVKVATFGFQQSWGQRGRRAISMEVSIHKGWGRLSLNWVNTRSSSINRLRRLIVASQAIFNNDDIRELELVGFVVLKRVLDTKFIRSLKKELRSLPTSTASYSDKQHYVHNIQWLDCPLAMDTIVLPTMMQFLSSVFGDDLVCTGCTYARTEPGYEGMALHTDSQPYGSDIFGLQASSPQMLRVLFYLDDLTELRSPLKVVPYSHLSLHSDANPYRRYRSHPEELAITCPAGSAVVINQRIFHSVAPNRSRLSRELLAASYRPAWAGPIANLPEPDVAALNRLPASVRRLFATPNIRKVDFHVKNWTKDLEIGGIGIGPLHWKNVKGSASDDCE